MPDALINDYMFWQEGESLLIGHLKREIDARVMTKTRLRVEVLKVRLPFAFLETGVPLASVRLV